MRDFIDFRGASGVAYRFRLWPVNAPHLPMAGNYVVTLESDDGFSVVAAGESNDLSFARKDLKRLLSEHPTAFVYILKLTSHVDYELAVPTPDHFVPLLYLAGVAAEDGSARALVRGYALGSLSMTCYGVGIEPSLCVTAQGAAQLPEGVPADQTNM